MASYTPPTGYTNSQDIMRLQQQLNASGANLKVDGIYGPLTDAAYKNNASSGVTGTSPFPAGQQAYMNALMSGLKSADQDSYLTQLQAALRPSVDSAIKARQQQTLTNRANIDADAASRGMLGSTWVTDVKDRQQQYEADDVAGMENQYNANLASGLANYQAAALSRDDSNYWNAMQMSHSLYQNDLAKSGTSSRGGSVQANQANGKIDDSEDISDYLSSLGYTSAGAKYLALGNLEGYLQVRYTDDAIKAAKKKLLASDSAQYSPDER